MTEQPDESEDQADDGQNSDLMYVARLKKSNRPKKLVAAVLLLLLAMRRAKSESWTHGGVRQELHAQTLLTARAIAAYVKRQTCQTIDATHIADKLLRTIGVESLQATQTLTGNKLSARLGLIIQTETQRATAAAFQDVSTLLPTITRETTSEHPCIECDSLAGTYTAPYPPELWYTHPRCACVFSSP